MSALFENPYDMFSHREAHMNRGHYLRILDENEYQEPRISESCHEKTCFLHMRKQRRRSAAQLPPS